MMPSIFYDFIVLHVERGQEKSKKKNFQKLRLLPLSIYLHKTFAISKYLQFSIYKLNENVGNLPTILEKINCQQYWNLNLHHIKTSQLICKGNQLTGVHTIWPPIKTYFQTDPTICLQIPNP